MTVKATKLKDIRDKEQLYIVIGDAEQKVVINVGKKTFDAVEKLLNSSVEKKTETKKEK